MPIYEFYCPDCHRLFPFLAKSVNTTRRPACPRCGRPRLERQVSLFAAVGRRGGGEGGEEGDAGGGGDLDDARMERAMEALAGEAETLDEKDPRQAAQLMRKFSRMAGVEFGGKMEETIGRLEAGEDPEALEGEWDEAEGGEEGEDGEDLFRPSGPGAPRGRRGGARSAPVRDPGLYDL